MSALKMLTRIITEQGYKRLRDKPKKLRNFNNQNLSLQKDREGYRTAYGRAYIRRGIHRFDRVKALPENAYEFSRGVSKEKQLLDSLNEIEKSVKEYDREIIKLKGYKTRIIR